MNTETSGWWLIAVDDVGPIAERTRAHRGDNQQIEPEILFDRVQNKKNDPFLEEKEEYSFNYGFSVDIVNSFKVFYLANMIEIQRWSLRMKSLFLPSLKKIRYW